MEHSRILLQTIFICFIVFSESYGAALLPKINLAMGRSSAENSNNGKQRSLTVKTSSANVEMQEKKTMISLAPGKLLITGLSNMKGAAVSAMDSPMTKESSKDISESPNSKLDENIMAMMATIKSPITSEENHNFIKKDSTGINDSPQTLRIPPNIPESDNKSYRINMNLAAKMEGDSETQDNKSEDKEPLTKDKPKTENPSSKKGPFQSNKEEIVQGTESNTSGDNSKSSSKVNQGMKPKENFKSQDDVKKETIESEDDKKEGQSKIEGGVRNDQNPLSVNNIDKDKEQKIGQNNGQESLKKESSIKTETSSSAKTEEHVKNQKGPSTSHQTRKDRDTEKNNEGKKAGNNDRLDRQTEENTNANKGTKPQSATCTKSSKTTGAMSLTKSKIQEQLMGTSTSNQASLGQKTEESTNANEGTKKESASRTDSSKTTIAMSSIKSGKQEQKNDKKAGNKMQNDSEQAISKKKSGQTRKVESDAPSVKRPSVDIANSVNRNKDAKSSKNNERTEKANGISSEKAITISSTNTEKGIQKQDNKLGNTVVQSTKYKLETENFETREDTLTSNIEMMKGESTKRADADISNSPSKTNQGDKSKNNVSEKTNNSKDKADEGNKGKSTNVQGDVINKEMTSSIESTDSKINKSEVTKLTGDGDIHVISKTENEKKKHNDMLGDEMPLSQVKPKTENSKTSEDTSTSYEEVMELEANKKTDADTSKSSTNTNQSVESINENNVTEKHIELEENKSKKVEDDEESIPSNNKNEPAQDIDTKRKIITTKPMPKDEMMESLLNNNMSEKSMIQGMSLDARKGKGNADKSQIPVVTEGGKVGRTAEELMRGNSADQSKGVNNKIQISMDVSRRTGNMDSTIEAASSPKIIIDNTATSSIYKAMDDVSRSTKGNKNPNGPLTLSVQSSLENTGKSVQEATPNISSDSNNSAQKIVVTDIDAENIKEMVPIEGGKEILSLEKPVTGNFAGSENAVKSNKDQNEDYKIKGLTSVDDSNIKGKTSEMKDHLKTMVKSSAEQTKHSDSSAYMHVGLSINP